MATATGAQSTQQQRSGVNWGSAVNISGAGVGALALAPEIQQALEGALPSLCLLSHRSAVPGVHDDELFKAMRFYATQHIDMNDKDEVAK